jgi:hypothetical protein
MAETEFLHIEGEHSYLRTAEALGCANGTVAYSSLVGCKNKILALLGIPVHIIWNGELLKAELATSSVFRAY